MLGIRLSPESERELERHARALGRGKSVVAREWILERLQRESIDQRMRRAAAFLATADTGDDQKERDAAARAWFEALDAEDGGFDWGQAGPPV